VWYALGSCNGNEEYLIEMILAIAEHVAGNHTFPGRAGLNSYGSETKNSDPVSDLEAWIRASGSVPKSHGSITLRKTTCKCFILYKSTPTTYFSVAPQLVVGFGVGGVGILVYIGSLPVTVPCVHVRLLS
jgi:hypothetical protein